MARGALNDHCSNKTAPNTLIITGNKTISRRLPCPMANQPMAATAPKDSHKLSDKADRGNTNSTTPRATARLRHNDKGCLKHDDIATTASMVTALRVGKLKPAMAE